MKRTIQFLLIPVLAACVSACAVREETPQWKLGVQTYTFHKFPLAEAFSKIQQLGLHYAEAFTWQELGGEFPAGTNLNAGLPAEQLDQLKALLKKYDINLFACGVVGFDTEADWRSFFTFGKEIGLTMMTAEPKFDQLDMVENLAKEFNIKVAIHNHPTPSEYADPDVLAKALKGRSPLMGVCADIGHWKRSGFDPLQTLKRFNGRLMVIHIKDLNDKMEDAVWGKGILPIKEVISELRRQKFDGLISVEYENFSDSQFRDIINSLEYLKSLYEGNAPLAILGELDNSMNINTLAPREAEKGWKLLFDGRSTQGWHGYNMKVFPDCWAIEDGCLTMNSKGGGEDQDIVTDKVYRNFALSLEYKLTQGANSGIIYQIAEDPKYKYPYETGPEFQVIDHENWPDPLEDWQINAANYAMYPPMARPFKPLGEWNQLLLVVNGNEVTQILNGEIVVKYVRGTEDWLKLRNSGKWLNFPDWGMFDEGVISLQNHGTKVWYRNIKLKELLLAGSHD
jgi:sugar phosphate isomerase/epimerase